MPARNFWDIKKQKMMASRSTWWLEMKAGFSALCLEQTGKQRVAPFQLNKSKRILHTVTCEKTDADAFLVLPRPTCRTLRF
jgi:hypothetical protein